MALFLAPTMATHLSFISIPQVVLLGRYNAQGLGAQSESTAKTVIVTEKGIEVENTKYALENNENACVHDNTGLDRSKLIANNSDNRGDNSNNSCSSNANSSSCNSEVEIWTRVTPDDHYIKAVVLRGRVVGALLVGDTGLEEVFENLILNRMDVSHIGVHLLDPALDLEDYFD